VTFARGIRPTHGMSRSTPIREASALLAALLLASVPFEASGQSPAAGQQTHPAASGLPATQPTASVAASTPIARTPVTRLEVQFESGKLTVDAANVGLNRVLREIADKTGIKISGGVGDESVFGHYGPSSPAEVLSALLDGTASNMLLVENKKGPQELILTPRHGGPTPPNPNATTASSYQNEPQEPEQQYVPPIRPYQPPTPTGRGPVSANPDGSPAFNPPPPDATSPQSTGSEPKTPQQIYEQLQSLSKQTPAAPQQ